jgi:4-hydroxybenzoate polyprenyltransferase
VGGADWVINMLGFGSITPFAGWAASGRPLTPAGAWIIAGFCPLFAALYPLTQLYQFEEDSRRGDRTLALLLGLRRSLAIAIGSAALAFACFARATVIAGGGSIRWGSMLVALVAWGSVLLPWFRSVTTYPPERHKRSMYLALGAWGVTDVAMVIAFAI